MKTKHYLLIVLMVFFFQNVFAQQKIEDPILIFQVKNILLANERIHKNQQNWFKSEISHLLTIETRSVENGFNDVAYIRFLNDATPSFDSKWDAFKLLSGVPEVPQIYTAASEAILAINSIPETDRVPLFFEAGKPGIYTLEITEANDFEKVILEDKLSGTKTDLLAEPYTFNINEGDDASRFVIHFKDVPLNSDDNNMTICSASNNVFVLNKTSQQGEVSIFNILGHQVTSAGMRDGKNIITLDSPVGIYIMKVKTGETTLTKKVYLK